jgi:ribonuclease BN (tRNA processing enzyme)
MFSKSRSTGMHRLWLVAILLTGLPLYACAADDSACTGSGIALQVLGSGGPIADDGRASSGYLVWVDGESRYLIDAGGGVFLRFAEAGGNFSELDFIGISHFHADHSADLVALLKSGNFANRERKLPISGPAGDGPFPGLQDYLNSLLSSEYGAYRYLSGYLDGKGRLPLLDQIEVDPSLNRPVTVFSDADAGVRIDALYVPHGIVPAIAFRIQIGDESIVFASDQNGSSKDFLDFARAATVLVMHMPVPEGVTGAGRKLHAPPSVIGDIAAQADVGQLVLSHFMARSLRDLDGNVALVRSRFDGPVLSANDLDCVTVGQDD